MLILEELWRRSGGVLEELWRRCGGGLEEVWGSSGGGLECSGGGLEELWRRSGEEGCNLGLDWPKVQCSKTDHGSMVISALNGTTWIGPKYNTFAKFALQLLNVFAASIGEVCNCRQKQGVDGCVKIARSQD